MNSSLSGIQPTADRTFTVATDESLARFIRSARDRILFIAPGIDKVVAQALVERLPDPRLSVTVILDSDPEVYRLGFGTPEGLAILKGGFDANQFGLRCEPGIRIGVLVADDKTMVYSPVPQLIEAGSTLDSKHNALFLDGAIATRLAEATGSTSSTRISDGEIGKKAMTPQDVAAIKKNIDENPPEPFDLTRKVRVFSSKLQYVEFSVEKYQLTRQTVPIPAYLMGLGGDMEDNWRNSLRVLKMEEIAVKLDIVGPGRDGKSREISVDPRYLDDERKRIEKKFLIPVAGFGRVMFKIQQKDFEVETGIFRALLAMYSEKLKAKLDQSISELVNRVVNRLLPTVKANPPEQYKRFGATDDSDLAKMLERDISEAITMKTIVHDPIIKIVFKDISYQSVTSDVFQTKLLEALSRANVPPSKIKDIFPESNAVLEKGGKL